MMGALRPHDRAFAMAALVAGAICAGCPPREEATVQSAEEAMLWRPDEAGEKAAPRDPLLERVKQLAARSRRRTRPEADAATAEPPDRAQGGRPDSEADLLPPLDGAAEARPPQPKPVGLVLGPGDELDVAVGGQPEFSGRVHVREDGSVALPTTGDLVGAAGFSPRELADSIAGAIWPRYAKRKPAVSVVLVRSPRLVYYVFGAVRGPGRYEMPPTGISVLDAVMRASQSAPSTGGSPRVLGFEPVRGAQYERVYVCAPASSGGGFRIVDVAGAMRGGAGGLAVLSPGEVVVVPAGSGEWSEDELRKRLSPEGAAAELFVTGGSP